LTNPSTFSAETFSTASGKEGLLSKNGYRPSTIDHQPTTAATINHEL